MNAYTRIQKHKLWKVGKDGEEFEEDDKEVASFIKTSAIVTSIHHFLLLIVVITMTLVESSLFQHWEGLEFVLKPSEHDFYKMLLNNHSSQ